MALKYLIDENVDPIYTIQLRRLKPDLFVLAIGDLTTPPKGTLDPEILLWCEEHNFVLVTNNRKSMPLHLADHIAQNLQCLIHYVVFLDATSLGRSYSSEPSCARTLYSKSKIKRW